MWYLFTKKLWISVLGLILVVLGYGYFLFSTQSTIEKVVVFGDYKKTSKSDIQESIGKHLDIGWYSLDIQELQNELKKHAWIADIKISRVWPSSLTVELSQRAPIAIWNKIGLFAQDGEVFYPNSIEDISVPKLSGVVGHENEVLQAYIKLEKVCQLKKLMISELLVDKRGAIDLTLKNGMQILLGKNEPIKKMQRFVQIYDKVFTNKVGASRVDLRYPKGMAVKWNKSA